MATMVKKRYYFPEIDAVYSPFLGGYWTPAIHWLLLLHAGVYALQFLGFALFGEDPIREWLAAGAGLSGWRLLTCWLVHDLMPWELLCTSAVLACMGGDMERAWGRGLFLSFYCGSNVICSALRLLLAPEEPVCGSLPGALGIATALSLLYPQRMVYGRCSLRRLAILSGAAAAAAGCWFCSPARIFSYMACLPAAMTALLFFPIVREKCALRKLVREVYSSYEREESQQQTDEILDKIVERGMAGLTAEERRLLKKNSRRMKNPRSRP